MTKTVKKPRRRCCTFCGKLEVPAKLMPDPQYPDVLICKERTACMTYLRSNSD